MDSLELKLVLHIFQYIPANELYTFKRVSQRFEQIITENWDDLPVPTLKMEFGNQFDERLKTHVTVLTIITDEGKALFDVTHGVRLLSEDDFSETFLGKFAKDQTFLMPAKMDTIYHENLAAYPFLNYGERVRFFEWLLRPAEEVQLIKVTCKISDYLKDTVSKSILTRGCCVSTLQVEPGLTCNDTMIDIIADNVLVFTSAPIEV